MRELTMHVSLDSAGTPVYTLASGTPAGVTQLMNELYEYTCEPPRINDIAKKKIEPVSLIVDLLMIWSESSQI